MAKFEWYEIYCQDPRGSNVDWAARAADARIQRVANCICKRAMTGLDHLNTVFMIPEKSSQP